MELRVVMHHELYGSNIFFGDMSKGFWVQGVSEYTARQHNAS